MQLAGFAQSTDKLVTAADHVSISPVWRTALGVSPDTPLAGMYMGQCIPRLADGPGEVHRMAVDRHKLKKHAAQ